jgi:AcrR family transcriptional regulator
MEEVAHRAGVGMGTVYRRFPSKEHLFAAVSHAACTDTHHCLAEAAQGTHDPVDKLRSIVVVHYRRSAQQAALLDLHSGHVSGQQACHAQSEQQQLYESLHRLLHEVIGEGQRQGMLRDGDPAILACLCLELLHPRAFQNLQRMLQRDVEEIAEHVVTFMLRGLDGGRSPWRHRETERERTI